MIRVYLDGSETAYAQAQEAADGTFSTRLALVPAGAHTVEVTAQLAGQSESARAVQTITVQRAPPPPPPPPPAPPVKTPAQLAADALPADAQRDLSAAQGSAAVAQAVLSAAQARAANAQTVIDALAGR